MSYTVDDYMIDIANIWFNYDNRLFYKNNGNKVSIAFIIDVYNDNKYFIQYADNDNVEEVEEVKEDAQMKDIFKKYNFDTSKKLFIEHTRGLIIELPKEIKDKFLSKEEK